MSCQDTTFRKLTLCPMCLQHFTLKVLGIVIYQFLLISRIKSQSLKTENDMDSDWRVSCLTVQYSVLVYVLHQYNNAICTIKSSNHEDIWYSCEKCDKSFDREDKLQVHVKFKSAHENIWHLCVKCDNSFAGQDELQKHVRSDHECICYT